VVDHASEVYVRGHATSDLRLARTRDARAPAPGQFEAVGLHAVTEQRAAVVISEISSTAAPSTGESSVRLVPVETDGHGSRTNQASAGSCRHRKRQGRDPFGVDRAPGMQAVDGGGQLFALLVMR